MQKITSCTNSTITYPPLPTPEGHSPGLFGAVGYSLSCFLHSAPFTSGSSNALRSFGHPSYPPLRLPSKKAQLSPGPCCSRQAYANVSYFNIT